MQLQQTNNKKLLINESKELKLFLHNFIYSDLSKINELNNLIAYNFNVFKIEFNENEKSFEIKIKKTTMKKLQNESSVYYYYDLLNKIFVEFFKNNIELFKMMNASISNELFDLLLDHDFVYTLYTITAISDNIIILYL